MDARRDADVPRELVALVQRRSLAILPLWTSLAVAAALGSARLGNLDPVPLVYAAGFLLMWWLRRLHRHWYGDVRASEAQRTRGYLTGLVMVGAFVVMTIVGPRAVPSPVPFVLGAIFAASVIWDPWRVSLHWLVVSAVLLWMSVVHVVGPEWALAPWTTPFLIGTAGMSACIVDHALMLRLIRRTSGIMTLGASHV